MGSTYHSLYAHIFFHTKLSRPVIRSAWKQRLYRYVSRLLDDYGVTVLAVGAVEDHIHLFIRYRPVHALADILRTVKSNSSRWIRQELNEAWFQWQEGYTAISVSPSLISVVSRYVRNQEEHHREISARDELVEILNKLDVDYDPRGLP